MQIRNALTEFLEDIAPTMPGLFSTPCHKGTVIADDEALLEYELPAPIDIDAFMDILEDDLGLTMLLHFIEGLFLHYPHAAVLRHPTAVSLQCIAVRRCEYVSNFCHIKSVSGFTEAKIMRCFGKSKRFALF